MNIPLGRLETHVDDSVLLRAETLLDGGAVQALAEAERHLWVARVEDDSEALEVEIKITPGRLVGATCECAAYRRSGMCPHIVAAGLTLRARLQEREQRARREREKQKKPARLTTPLILDAVEAEDLKAFVREYARRHRPFALALKARFAGAVDAPGGKEKFSQVLDSAITLARGSGRHLGKRAVNRLSRILQQLDQQGENALQAGNFLMVFDLHRAVLDKVPPLLSKTLAGEARLRDAVESSLDQLQRLQRTAAPALARNIRDFAEEQVSRLRYRAHRLDLRLLPLLLGAAPTPEDFSELQLVVDALERTYREEGRDPGPLLQCQFNLLYRHRRMAAAHRLVVGRPDHPSLLAHALERAVGEGDSAWARGLAKSALEASASQRGSAQDLLDIVLPYLEAWGTFPSAVPLLRQRLLDEQDGSMLPALRRAAGDQWPSVAGNLIKDLSNFPDAPPLRRLRLELYTGLGDLNGLMELLEREASIDLLMGSDRLLIPTYTDRVMALYRRLLAQFAQGHLGPKSSRKIREVLDHLLEVGQPGLSRQLARNFRETYPERHTLMEELAHF